MDRYPCVNRYKHGVDCPGWVNVHGARCEDCVVVCNKPKHPRTLLTLDSTTARRQFDVALDRQEGWVEGQVAMDSTSQERLLSHN
ncbi:hypothetical protein CORC01_10825 [Colletotrichum orchidophilum]|uniref:Uncharacterized protein n=1 Tax=Colletotrichum orchidophilum TaxID=1209926 RepID=A0A1G4AXS7_9PEZI|nr:uncharacterized protein CORC01_10825 [Colletotrichum orchidophilum]OHE93926.1 hypothetical protein CORC01_10825 [Colletotrichum orchidophilum]